MPGTAPTTLGVPPPPDSPLRLQAEPPTAPDATLFLEATWEKRGTEETPACPWHTWSWRSQLPPTQGFYTNTPTLGLPGLLFTQNLGQVPQMS